MPDKAYTLANQLPSPSCNNNRPHGWRHTTLLLLLLKLALVKRYKVSHWFLKKFGFQFVLPFKYTLQLILSGLVDFRNSYLHNIFKSDMANGY